MKQSLSEAWNLIDDVLQERMLASFMLMLVVSSSVVLYHVNGDIIHVWHSFKRRHYWWPHKMGWAKKTFADSSIVSFCRWSISRRNLILSHGHAVNLWKTKKLSWTMIFNSFTVSTQRMEHSLQAYLRKHLSCEVSDFSHDMQHSSEGWSGDKLHGRCLHFVTIVHALETSKVGDICSYLIFTDVLYSSTRGKQEHRLVHQTSKSFCGPY